MEEEEKLTKLVQPGGECKDGEDAKSTRGQLAEVRSDQAVKRVEGEEAERAWKGGKSAQALRKDGEVEEDRTYERRSYATASTRRPQPRRDASQS